MQFTFAKILPIAAAVALVAACGKKEEKPVESAAPAPAATAAADTSGGETIVKIGHAAPLTGGIAHSKYVTDVIRDYVSSIAPVYVYPGEHEMESLGEQSYEALIGKAEVFEL